MKQIRLTTKKDFKLNWFSGTGAGGQHRNKHQNCLRLTHIESGITVVAQTCRDRQSNLRHAIERIKPLLLEYYQPSEDPVRIKATETIRTYHEPDNRVKDHASGLTRTYKEIVLDGELDEMIKARLEAVPRD